MRGTELLSMLTDPVSGAAAATIDDRELVFEDGTRYVVHRGAPVVFHEASLFTDTDVLNDVPTTQDRSYRDGRRFKNRVRKAALPTLARSSSPGSSGCRSLASQRAGGTGLVIGAGDRVDQYREDFSALGGLVCSDVHTQFGSDIVFDAHWIPIRDATFDVVLAAEVLEHTIRPWRVAEELERVTAADGLIQVEVPFVFPLHSAPYDFFRFTLFGLRSLFPRCEMKDVRVAGGFSASAVALSDAMTNLSSRRYARIALSSAGRFVLAGFKYLDRSPTADWRSASLPRSISLTLQRDGIMRHDRDLLEEVQVWLDESERQPWQASTPSRHPGPGSHTAP